MQFLVLGFDGSDDEAPARRQAARPHHLALGDQMVSDGTLWYGAALTDDDGAMNGSMYVVDFADHAQLELWLEQEPYVTGGVWQRIEIRTCATNKPWQFSRPREFFESRK